MRFSRFLLLLVLAGIAWSSAKAADTVYVRETQVPILIERQDNVLYYLRLNAKDSQTLNEITLDIDPKEAAAIECVKLYYGGTEALQDRPKKRFAPVEYISGFTPGKTLAANPSYSIECAKAISPSGKTTLKCDYPLFPGYNFFWVSLQSESPFRLRQT